MGVRMLVWLGVNLLTVFFLCLIRIINFVSKLCTYTYFSTAYTVVTHAIAIVIVVATFLPTLTSTDTHKHTDAVYGMCLPFYVYSLNLCHYRCLLCGVQQPPFHKCRR